MRPRAITAADREAQVLALWKARQRSGDDVVSFYNWLVDYAPWLVRGSTASIDAVRALLEPHTFSR